jgi:glycine oxidase
MKVVVVGAGVCGLAIGWKLARAGASVTVLERSHIGGGATMASEGIIASGGGLERQAVTAWPAFREALEAESKIDIGWHCDGALRVRQLGDGNAPSPHLDGDEVHAIEPLLGPLVAGADMVPEASVDSQALCRALAVALVRAGGEILSNEAAVRFEWDGKRVTGVTTPFTVHHADMFVLAMGAWSSRVDGLPPGAIPAVRPVKGEVVVLAPPSVSALPRRAVHGQYVRLVPQRDRLLVGATIEDAGFDTCLSQAALRWLYQEATALMPSLAGWRRVEHWAGLRAVAADGQPVLGPAVIDGLAVASGLFSSGILLAPTVAEVLSRFILDRTAVDPACDPRRFESGSPDAPLAETPHKDVSGEAETWRTGS